MATVTFEVHRKFVSWANARGHRMALAAKKAEERNDVHLAWLAAGRPTPVFDEGPAVVEFVRVAPRPLDTGDNLPSAFKCARDELTRDFGLANDAGPEVAWVYEQERGAPKTYRARVTITAPAIRVLRPGAEWETLR